MADRVVLILISSLAVWRIAHMLVSEEGPFNIFDRLRGVFRVKYTEMTSEPYGLNFLSKLFSCVYCLSLWLALLVCVAVFGIHSWLDVVTIFAVSALAIFYEEVINGTR